MFHYDLTSFLFFHDIRAILAHTDTKLGIGDKESNASEVNTPDTDVDALSSDDVPMGTGSLP